MIQFIRTLLSIVIFMPLSGMHFRYEDNYASLARSILFEHNVIGNSFDAVEKAVKVIDSYFPLHIFTSTCHSCVIPDQARIFKNVIVDSLSCFISSSSSIISKLELVYDILNLKIPNENIEIATNNILIILSQLLFDSDGAPCEQTTKLTLSNEHAKNIVHNISHLCTSTSDYLHTIKSLEGKDSNLDLVVHEVIALYKKCAHELLTGTRIQHTLPVCVDMHTNSSSQPYTDFKQKIVNNSITVSLLKVIECLKRGDYEQYFKIAKEQGVFEYLPSLKYALRVKITQITEKKWGISSNKLAEISQESYARAQPIAIVTDTQYAPLSETHRDQLRLYKDIYEQSLISADKDPTVSLETEKRMHAIDMTLEGPLEKTETCFYTEAKIEFAVAFKVEQLTRMGLSASVPYIRLVGLLPVAKKAIRNFADSLKIVRKNREFITSVAGPAIKYTVHASDNIYKDFNQLKQDLNRVINAACKKSLRIAGNSGIHNIIDHHLTQKLINNYGHNLVEQAAHIVGTYHNFFDKLGNAEKLQKVVERLKKIYSYSFGKSYLDDRAIGGTIKFGTIQEAQAAIACQEQGLLRSLTRATSLADDFIEDLGSGIVRRWDVKTPTSFAVNNVWKNNFKGDKDFWRALTKAASQPKDYFIINITDLVSEHIDEFFSGLKKHCTLAELNRMVIVHAENPGLSMTTQHLVNWYLFD